MGRKASAHDLGEGMLGMLVQCTEDLYAVLTVEALCVLSCNTKNRHLRFHNEKSSNLRFFARHEKSQFLLLCANLDISVLWHTLTFTSTFLKAFSSVRRYALLVCSPGWLMRRPNGASQSPQLSTEGWNKLGHDRSTPNDVQESLAMIECSN